MDFCGELGDFEEGDVDDADHLVVGEFEEVAVHVQEIVGKDAAQDQAFGVECVGHFDGESHVLQIDRLGPGDSGGRRIHPKSNGEVSGC